jgi:hypothetical protein
MNENFQCEVLSTGALRADTSSAKLISRLLQQLSSYIAP